MTNTKQNKRVLVLVESPNKVKTIKQFLPSNYVVMASVGHITKIADTGDYNLGIDIKNDFKASYIIEPSKLEVVKKLKEQVRLADEVILMSDPDREGEAISWHLVKELNIPKSKYKRTTVHEITKKAVLEALNNTRDIDLNLVNAATTREKEDKIIGYILSQITRKNVAVKAEDNSTIIAKTAGRCQSPAVGLIVNREEEIKNFKPEYYYDFYVYFKKNNIEFKAKYIGTDDGNVKLKTREECDKLAAELKKNDFEILDITQKDSLENPKPPFITATFQQEVSKKLGISIKDATDAAQKLFEGIDIGGKHVALITYIRTDDATYAPEFMPVLKDYVENTFGKNYYAPVRAGKKAENAQEGHEGIRCIDLTMTPEKLATYIDNTRLLKVYEIIWKRTVASGMKPAIISNTIYTIKNGKHRFVMTSKELRFEGYRKVYSYNTDDDNENSTIIKEVFNKKEVLKDTSLEAIEKHTNPPARYNEASFIKELDKLGIGRPSTFATILQIILDKNRGYTKLENKEIVPTELGIKLWHFLSTYFSNIISISYTSEMEKDLDLIATGKMDSVECLTTLYNRLIESKNKIDPVETETRVCPECGKPMKIRTGKYGKFWGCTGYPDCKHIEKLK